MVSFLTTCKCKFQAGMHSSRMRTGRSLTVCWAVLPGGVSASVHAGIHPPPQEQTTPQSRHPGEQTPPGADTPPLGADTPPGQTHPPRSRHPPEQTPPWIRHPPPQQTPLPPGADIPPEQTHPPGADTPPVNRMTGTSKNITLATTSLRPVMNSPYLINSINQKP